MPKEIKNFNKTITLYQYYVESEDSLSEDDVHEKFDPFLEPDLTDEVDIKISDVKLGEGGMGIVFEGTQKFPERSVAVKRLKKRGPRYESLFKHEAMITGKLIHPNILPIFIFRPEGVQGPEVIMPLLDGQNLEHKLEKNEIPLRKSLEVVNQICYALSYAHSRQVYHRDIKPENIMLGLSGEVYLVDWGIALDLSKENHVKRMVGTPAYMAPEMLSGNAKDVDARTDIYLLGAMIHRLLTGKTRHSGNSFPEISVQIRKSAPHIYPKSIFRELGLLCNKCCHKNPEKRPQTVQIFQAELIDALEHWDTMNLIQKGREQIEELKKDTSSKEAYPTFVQARIIFEQALMSWPTSGTAQRGVINSILLMLEKLLAERELGTAQKLFSDLLSIAPNHPKVPSLQESISILEQRRLSYLEGNTEDEAELSREVCARVLTNLGIISVAGFLLTLFTGRIVNLSDQDLFLNALIPIVYFSYALFRHHSFLFYSRASKTINILIMATLGVMLCHRVFEYIYSSLIPERLAFESVFLILFWSNMIARYRRAVVLTGIHTVIAIFCFCWGAYSFVFINLGMILTFFAASYLWNERV
ncbi:MAG: hypothetical protein CL916_04195 [Deltaproteobacteria bacterium]|nr:hypothetical protein [Deltaproteobacteria bacterium]